MYAELFLIDEFMMDLLIVRIAAAVLSLRPRAARQLLFSALSAAAALLAAFWLPWLKSPVMRLFQLALLARAIPSKGFKGFLYSAAATLFATLTAGGCAFAAAYLSGGGAQNGFIAGNCALRTAIFGAVGASFIPVVVRRLLGRRIKNGCTIKVTLLHRGLVRSFSALIDTGNALREPVSGLPVAVICCRALEKSASIPIPAATPAGKTVLMGFVPERFCVDGRDFACIVAVTKHKLPAEAILPPDAAEPGITRK